MDPSAELWEAWSAGRLCLQGCEACGALQHPPSQVCSTCHSTAMQLVDVDADCILVTWSTVHRAPAPVFAADIPYTVAIVSVEGGALVQARVTADAMADEFAPGQPMRLALVELAGRTVPVVSPA